MLFEPSGGDLLLVTAPPTNNIAPPGMYFLYTINDQGVPSGGVVTYVSTDPKTQSERDWNTLWHGHPD